MILPSQPDVSIAESSEEDDLVSGNCEVDNPLAGDEIPVTIDLNRHWPENLGFAIQDPSDTVLPKQKKKIFPIKENSAKKRFRDESEWKRKKAAKLREAGKSYTSQTGTIVPEKKAQLINLCTGKCVHRCDNSFNEEQRKSILSSYYKLDINAKNALLFKSIVKQPVKRHVVGARKQRVSAERGQLVTFVGIITADGERLPPAYVFPRVKCKEHFTFGGPDGSLGLANPSGWISATTFFEVIKHVQKAIQSSSTNPVLVLFDNHESHCTL